MPGRFLFYDFRFLCTQNIIQTVIQQLFMLLNSFCRKAEDKNKSWADIIITGPLKSNTSARKRQENTKSRQSGTAPGTGAWGKSAGGKTDQPAESQSISNVCLCECVGVRVCAYVCEEATALSRPVLSVLQDVLHQQNGGGWISYTRPSDFTFLRMWQKWTTWFINLFAF